MNKKSAFKGVDLKRFGMLIALVIIIVLFTILTKGLILKPMNIGNLINQNSYVVILAVGMLLCILTGGNIDLSVGSVVALIGACAGTFIITLGWNVYLSIGLCLLIGIAVGAWQGFWIAYVGIPPFITTLSGMLVFRGITLLILNGLTLAPFPDAYQKLSTGFLPDLVESFTLFGGKSNLLCIIVGVLAVVVFCVAQLMNNANRKRKGYECESPATIAVKMVVVSAVVLWVFYTLAQYRGVPTVLIILAVLFFRAADAFRMLGFYLCAYGAMRFVMEMFRGDALRGIWLLSTSQWIALILIPLGIAMMCRPDWFDRALLRMQKKE